MPVIVDLRMNSMGSPSTRIFTEFCAWLSSNDSLKVLVTGVPSHLSSSSPDMWEDLGFALFSPFSKLTLDYLELKLGGIADCDVENMVTGSKKRVSIGSQQSPHLRCSPHRRLKLRISRVSPSTLKFIRHFGYAIHDLDTTVDEVALLQLLLYIRTFSPELRELRVSLVRPASGQRITAEEAASIRPPTWSLLRKLRTFTIVDETGTRASPVVRQALALTGQSLAYLCISGHSATNALVDAIMQSCPVLIALDVDRAEASFWVRLSDSYSSGACKISDLSIWEATHDPSPWVLDLVQTLANPASPFTKTLKSLKLRGEFWAEAKDELQREGLEMLDKNPFLVQLVLPLDPQQRRAMLVKHGEVVAKATHPLHPRHRLALLSCDGTIPRDIWRLILDFSAQPVRRSVATGTTRRSRDFELLY